MGRIIRRKPAIKKSHNAQVDIPSYTIDPTQRVLKSVPTDKNEQDMLADEFVMWLITTDVVCLEEFPLNKMMSPTKFFELENSNSYFLDAMEFGRWAMSYRLQEGWKRGKIDQSFAIRMLPLYNMRYREYCLLRTESQARGKNEKAVINVITRAIPDSEHVKKRE